LFKVFEGDHEYFAAPVALSWLEPLLQSRSFDLVAVTIGDGNTVTRVDKVDVLLHTVSVI
jgi:hypothetical protein